MCCIMCGALDQKLYIVLLYLNNTKDSLQSFPHVNEGHLCLTSNFFVMNDGFTNLVYFCIIWKRVDVL